MEEDDRTWSYRDHRSGERDRLALRAAVIDEVMDERISLAGNKRSCDDDFTQEGEEENKRETTANRQQQ